jgi:hypothetical protein
VGPYIRLKARPGVNMVGDHDLFAFTQPGPMDYGKFIADTNQQVAQAQRALQNIWYWKPGTDFQCGDQGEDHGGARLGQR